MVQVDDAVDLRAARVAILALPGTLVVEAEPDAAAQAVAVFEPNFRSAGVGEVVEVDAGIDELRLRRQGQVSLSSRGWPPSRLIA